jgi:small-conductance mechanosensitive channel
MQAQKSVLSAQAAARNRLFVLNADPVWTLLTGRRGMTVTDSQQSLAAQWKTLNAYSARRVATFAAHAGAWLFLIPLLYWVRRNVRAWAAEDKTLAQTAVVFRYPVATATIAALFASAWIYPNAPRLLWAMIVAGALVPTILILRRLLSKVLHPVLNALVLFNLIDQLRSVTASLPLISRLLFLAEMAGGAMLLIWFIRSGRLKTAWADRSGLLANAIDAIARLYAVIFIFAGFLGAIGYTSLGTLLGNAILGSTYLAVILFVATRIAEGLTMSALRVRPISLLRAVDHNRKFVWLRICQLLHFAAILIWLLSTLELLTIRRPVIDALHSVVTYSLTVGSFSLSLGQVIAFGLTIWASILASRFIRFLLQEDVYPRLYLAKGLPYAISTVLHYAILLIGFTIAVQVLGYDMTRFTILAGAFGVGLGFGLQNIFNNFVSGLILLFERPIKVGDMVQIGADTGRVRRIGIRASIIRLGTGAEIIMPNGKLISDPVTNWTLSARGRYLDDSAWRHVTCDRQT